MRDHMVIPDTQVAPGTPTYHLEWVGQYILDRRPEVIIHLGDHWDMPSLSSYDKGKRQHEGRRYAKDIAAGNLAWEKLNRPLEDFNANRRKTKHAQWWPERHFLLGNHEERIQRAIDSDAQLEGLMGYHHFKLRGWTIHGFLEPVWLDGVKYAHYHYRPLSGRPYSGMIETRLKNIGSSFTQGHEQTLLYGVRHLSGPEGSCAQHGLVAGSCYLHDEEYKGPQGNAHWRGVIVKHAVEDGDYDPMFVRLDYLCRKYEGIPLEKFMRKIYPVAA